MKKELNVVDLFCGAGGLSFGFAKAGFNIILGVDNDKDSKETFLKNHPDSQYLLKDIRSVSKDEILSLIGDKKIDLLIGGPPCQGFSVSGKRVYMDSRNSLYLEFFRILDILKPNHALIENVPGLKGLFEGRALKSILEEFSKRGYKTNHYILKADEYGVPQVRKRIIIVASKKGEFEFPLPLSTQVTLGDAINDLPILEDSIEEDQYISKPKNEYQNLMRINSNKIHNHIASNHSDRTKSIIGLVPEGGNYKNLPKELRNTRKVHIAWTRLNSSKPSLTIDTGHRHHFHPWANRIPTVRESARIQSFPDNFIFYGSKTSQYRQVGNAVPPLLAEAIAQQLKKWINDENKKDIQNA